MEKISLFLLIAFVNYAASVNTCTTEGKFIADYNCTSYVVCARSETQLTSYTIPCPPGFHVRHTDMLCSVADTTGKCDPSYTCTSLGNFASPTSVNASIYISCVQGIGDMIIAISMECPASSEFNAVAGMCVPTDVPRPAQPVPTAAATVIQAANELAQVITEVSPAVIQSTTPTITPRMPNSSKTTFASFSTILTTILFYNTLV